MSSKSAKATTVGFRVSAEQFGRLADAATRAAISPHELARRIVLQALEATPKSELGPANVEPALAEIQKLRAELAVVFESFLIATEVFDSAEAHRFVTEKFA